MLIHADHRLAVEPSEIVDQDPLTLGENRVVRGVFQDTSSPSARRATVSCWITIPSSADRSPRRDNFARGSAAWLVSWRHT